MSRQRPGLGQNTNPRRAVSALLQITKKVLGYGRRMPSRKEAQLGESKSKATDQRRGASRQRYEVCQVKWASFRVWHTFLTIMGMTCPHSAVL